MLAAPAPVARAMAVLQPARGVTWPAGGLQAATATLALDAAPSSASAWASACEGAGPGGRGPLTAAAAAAAAAGGAARARPRRTRRGPRAARVGGCEPGMQPLMEWVRQHGFEVDGLEPRASGLEGGGNGVFATRDFAEGEVIARVPCSMTISSLGAPEAAAGLPPWAQLAAALLHEKRLGGASRFATYLASLPQAQDMPTHPMFWPRGLRPDALWPASPQGLFTARHALMRGVALTRALLSAGLAETEQEARWALAMVDSRSFCLGAMGEKPNLSFTPMLDFLNHEVEGGGMRPSCSMNDRSLQEGFVQLSADRDLKAGEELLISYDYGPSMQIFTRYAFVQRARGVDATDRFEKCYLEAPVDDPGLPGGEAARAARVRALKEVGWFRGAWRPLLLNLPDNVKAGGLLLPAARLCVLRSPEEVALLGVGVLRGGQLEEGLEVAAVALARRWVEEAINGVDTNLLRLARGGCRGQGPQPGAELLATARDLLGVERAVLSASLELLPQHVPS
ncbi:unnamed protein product [Prorocentrum cordatum]|uniref:SET domain-containing protein n=1 Tax=Prorocentrum cordatum TaxID=2364126 RepID=A0ABN9X9Z3_9DINO|nr:unnamed protein product [Polarella glacialis]